MNQTRDNIISIVRNVSPTIDLGDERNYDRSFKELGIDSLDTISMFLNVQEKFGIDEIPDEEIENLQTINQVTGYVLERLKAKK